jgi:ceramide glucosyltransferase
VITVVAGILAVWLLASAAYRVLSLRAIDRRLRDPEADAEPVPPSGEVVAFRPLKGAHPWLDACLESLWAAAAPTRTRVVLGVAAADDPAVAEVRSLMADAKERPPTELRVRPGPPGTNRKMANLVQMTEGVPADILAFSDADVEVPSDYLDRAVRPFKDHEVGLVTFPYRSVPTGRIASRVDALITNTQFLPSVATALEVQGLHFGLGASLVVRREALEKAGGLEALLEVAGDDYWMARNIESAGYRLEFVPLMLEHRLEDEGWRGSLRRHVRWNSVVREQRPLGYFGQITLHGLVPALGLALLGLAGGPLGAGAVALPFAYWGLEGRGLWKRRGLLGLRKRDLALLPVAGLTGFGVWVSGFLGRPRPS